MTEEQKHPGGRPTKYEYDYNRQALILAEKGFTDKDIAEVFEVTEQTINNWKNQFPQFFESLKKGKQIADKKVTQSLYFRALGYSHPEVHISNYQGDVTKTDIIKHYPPDPVSMIFWLKNRDKNNWRDDKNLNIGGQEDNPLNISITVNKVEKVPERPHEDVEAKEREHEAYIARYSNSSPEEETV